MMAPRWRGAAAWTCGTIMAAVSLYAGLDPLKVSPIANIPDFQAHHIDVPADWAQIQRVKDEGDKLRAAHLRFRNQVTGPESLAFDAQGRGPYTGLADGRVVRWDGDAAGWTDFAVTSRNRPAAVCAPKEPPGAPNLAHEHVCGRPLGLRFHRATGRLYIADAYLGLLSVGPQGGVAEPLVTQVDGVPMLFTNDVDVASDGVVYFTDSSTKYQRRQFFVAVVAGDNTGRLLRHDPATNQTKVLLDGLRFANGVALSKDESFLFVAESITGRLWKYWLKGPKADTAQVVAELPGFPDNVRRNEDGDFWIALHCRRSRAQKLLASHPTVRRYLMKLPIPLKYIYLLFSGTPHGAIVRCDPDGNIVEVLEDSKGSTVKLVSEVEERDGKLWIGSVLLPHIAVYTRNSST